MNLKLLCQVVIGFVIALAICNLISGGIIMMLTTLLKVATLPFSVYELGSSLLIVGLAAVVYWGRAKENKNGS